MKALRLYRSGLKNTVQKSNNTETAKRPHNIYEQMVINLTEQVLNNEALKEKFTVNKKLDMDSIVERANSFYTLLETVNTLKIKKLDEDEIMKLIGMK